VRAIVLFLADTCKPRNDLLSVVTYALAEFVQCLAEAPAVISGALKERALEAGFLFLRTYLTLASESLRKHEFLFHLRPKFHGLFELVYSLQGGPAINPDSLSTFPGEDFIGRVCRLIKSLHPALVHQRVVQRWLWGLGQQWKELEGHR
jgi:hypothetical protein